MAEGDLYDRSWCSISPSPYRSQLFQTVFLGIRSGNPKTIVGRFARLAPVRLDPGFGIVLIAGLMIHIPGFPGRLSMATVSEQAYRHRSMCGGQMTVGLKPELLHLLLHDLQHGQDFGVTNEGFRSFLVPFLADEC